MQRLLKLNNINSLGIAFLQIDPVFSFLDPVAGTSWRNPEDFRDSLATGTEYAESRVSRAPPPRPLRKTNN